MNHKHKGFTLMELMIAVAIVAILAAIALPSYSNYVRRSARANVQSDLMTAANSMERRKAQNFTYSGATSGTASTDTFSSISPTDSSAANSKYTISLIGIKADGTKVSSPASTDAIVGYEIKAVSTSNFATGSQTEVLKINHLGQKCYLPLGSAVSDCTIGSSPAWP